MTAIQVQLNKPWHEALADFYIQYPQATLKEVAVFFGVTPSWVSVVKNSDSFKELMRHRRDQHFGAVSASVIDRVEALAEQSIEELSRQMNDKELPVEHVKDIAAMSLKAMGFGGDRSGAGVVNNINVTVEREALLEARQKLLASRETLEVKIERIENDTDSSDGSAA